MPIITADGAGMSTAKGLSGVISSILNRAASFCPQLPPSPHTNDASGLTCPLQPSLSCFKVDFVLALRLPWPSECFHDVPEAPANNSEFASLSTEDDDSEDDGSEDVGSEDNSSEDDGSEDDGSEDDGSEDDDSEDDDSEDNGYQQDAVDRGVNEGGGAQW
ncbi:hypothetical protein C8R42DRAFT_641010 [Lentinula raphanica]|nr:hypothetical protein C8R42DRAFT_641010 [Lentinula raphanica]